MTPAPRSQIPKVFWTIAHFEEDLAEAAGMLELAKLYPHALDPGKWAAEVYRRTGALEDARKAIGFGHEALGGAAVDQRP